MLRIQTSSEASDDDVNLEPFRLASIKDRPPIFEAEALHEVLEKMAWAEPSEWVDTQVCLGKRVLCVLVTVYCPDPLSLAM